MNKFSVFYLALIFQSVAFSLNALNWTAAVTFGSGFSIAALDMKDEYHRYKDTIEYRHAIRIQAEAFAQGSSLLDQQEESMYMSKKEQVLQFLAHYKDKRVMNCFTHFHFGSMLMAASLMHVMMHGLGNHQRPEIQNKDVLLSTDIVETATSQGASVIPIASTDVPLTKSTAPIPPAPPAPPLPVFSSKTKKQTANSNNSATQSSNKPDLFSELKGKRLKPTEKPHKPQDATSFSNTDHLNALKKGRDKLKKTAVPQSEKSTADIKAKKTSTSGINTELIEKMQNQQTNRLIGRIQKRSEHDNPQDLFEEISRLSDARQKQVVDCFSSEEKERYDIYIIAKKARNSRRTAIDSQESDDGWD